MVANETAEATESRMVAAIETLAETNARIADLMAEDAARRTRRERQKHWDEVTDRTVKSMIEERRGKPHRITVIGWVNAIPGLAAIFDKEVPGDYLKNTAAGILIRCPCQQQPMIAQGQVVACRCGRWYCWDSQSVRVYRPKDESGTEQQGAQAGSLRREGPRSPAPPQHA